MDSINGFVWRKKQKVSDAVCWKCLDPEPTLFCACCARSFHQSPPCSQSKPMNAEAMQAWRCPECLAIKKDEQKMKEMRFDTEYINKVLRFVMDRILADKYLEPHYREVDYSSSAKPVAYPIDLLKMDKKVKKKEYRCWEGFLSDIKWIVHDTKAYVRSRKSNAFIARNWLMEFTSGELQSIRLCHECYVNANEHPDEWVSMVCSGNHPVVWAKHDTSPYWHAKLMGRNEQDGTVDVRFFGDNTNATITANYCIKYTENCPSSHFGKQKDKWIEAQAAAKVYMDKLISKCGPGIISNPNIPKPIPARRLTISGRDSIKPRSPTVASARIVNRRSTNVDRSNGKTEGNVINHQHQRFHFGRIKSTNQKVPIAPSVEANAKSVFKTPKVPVLSVERSKSSETLVKKRKVDQHSDTKTTKLATDDVMMAGPKEKIDKKIEVQSMVTLPMTLFDPNAVPDQSDAPAVAHGNTAAPPVSHQFGLLANPMSEMETDEIKTPSKPSFAMFVKSSPELMTKCESIVKDAMQNYTELTRTSFEAVVFELMNKHENQLQTMKFNEEKKMKSALEAQRKDYDGIIDHLRAKNLELNDKCTALQAQKAQNAKLMSQNSEATNAANASKMENDKLKAELEAANGKIVALHGTIKELVNHNGALHKSNAELTTTSQVLHQNLQRTMSELQKATQNVESNGRDFHQFCEVLKTKVQGVNASNEELNRLRQQCQWQTTRIQHMRNTFDETIAQAKKHPWCQGCGNPGEPYYCNRCRIQRMSGNQYFPSFGQKTFGNHQM